MRKITKIWLVVAAFFVVVGLILFGVVMMAYNWDFTKLSTIRYETYDYEINEDYKDILIVTNTADILLVPSENEETLLKCFEQKNLNHLVAVKGDRLVIEAKDTRKWYEYIGINFTSPKITLSIPRGEYGALSINGSTGNVEIPKDFKFESIEITESTGAVTNHASASESIKIKTSTGHICLENISAGAIDLSVSTGKVTVSGVTCKGEVTVGVSTGKAYFADIACKSVISSGTTGDVSLNNVVAADKLSIKRSTGDIRFDASDGAEIFVETDTGDVSGTLLSEKVFITETSTGRISVPKSVMGGRCEIVTETGDIAVLIEKS